MDTRGRGFGEPLEDGKNISEVTLWDTDAYAGLGEIFYERAMGYRCRTRDPDAADLYFVPAFSAQFGGLRSGWDPLNQLARQDERGRLCAVMGGGLASNA